MNIFIVMLSLPFVEEILEPSGGREITKTNFLLKGTFFSKLRKMTDVKYTRGKCHAKKGPENRKFSTLKKVYWDLMPKFSLNLQVLSVFLFLFQVLSWKALWS